MAGRNPLRIIEAYKKAIEEKAYRIKVAGILEPYRKTTDEMTFKKIETEIRVLVSKQHFNKIVEDHGSKKLMNLNVRTLYGGYLETVSRTSLKQLWNWPMLIAFPRYLQRERNYTVNESQIATGVAVAAMDTAFLFRLDLRRYCEMLAAQKPDQPVSKTPAIISNLTRITLLWITFCLSQEHFRNTMLKRNKGKNLTFIQQTLVGVQSGCCVGVIAGPIDFVTTRMFARGLKTQNSNSLQKIFEGSFWTKEFFRLNPPTKIIKTLYRGGSLGALSMMINNIASTYVKDFLENHKN